MNIINLDYASVSCYLFKSAQGYVCTGNKKVVFYYRNNVSPLGKECFSEKTDYKIMMSLKFSCLVLIAFKNFHSAGQ